MMLSAEALLATISQICGAIAINTAVQAHNGEYVPNGESVLLPSKDSSTSELP